MRRSLLLTIAAGILSIGQVSADPRRLICPEPVSQSKLLGARGAAYVRGLADLGVLADLVPADGYVHGANSTSIDAGIYHFLANIQFFDIATPLKQFVSSRQTLVPHCMAIHERVMLV